MTQNQIRNYLLALRGRSRRLKACILLITVVNQRHNNIISINVTKYQLKINRLTLIDLWAQCFNLETCTAFVEHKYMGQGRHFRHKMT